MSSIPPLHEIKDILFDEDKCMEFLWTRQVFYENMACQNGCAHGMALKRSEWKWRCRNKMCHHEKTVRFGTFFANSRLPCHRIMFMCYLWLLKTSAGAIALQTGLSKPTISAFMGHCRQLVSSAMDADDSIIGGEGIQVEIDECKLSKRKYNRGHRVDGAWIVGGVENTVERKAFFIPVESRDADTLLEVIRQHVRPGSLISTDMWKGYGKLSDIGFVHSTVNHSKHFKDPDTNCCTNRIEGTWNGLKPAIRPRNRAKEGLSEHLFEFLWRRKNSCHLWSAFIHALKEVHYA